MFWKKYMYTCRWAVYHNILGLVQLYVIVISLIFFIVIGQCWSRVHMAAKKVVPKLLNFDRRNAHKQAPIWLSFCQSYCYTQVVWRSPYRVKSVDITRRGEGSVVCRGPISLFLPLSSAKKVSSSRNPSLAPFDSTKRPSETIPISRTFTHYVHALHYITLH